MKKLVVICFFMLFVSGFINAQYSIEPMTDNSSLNWQSSIKKATSKAKSEKKPLLLFFTGSDWCGPCKMLVSDFFESERFNKSAKNEFILYEANFPRNKELVTDSQEADNARLKKKYKVTSFPTVIIVNANGKILSKRKGYNLMRDTSYYFDLIDSVLK